jgi:aminomethyltransferase
MSERTPLYEEHKKLNARLVEFGGWEMPLMYTTIIDEHTAVRTKAGIFDASHMGEFTITGKEAENFLGRVTVTDVRTLAPYQAKYSFFLNEKGGVIDDLIIYKRAEHDYFLVVNAGNARKDFDWLLKNKPAGAVLENLSDKLSLIALQGPDSRKILLQLKDGLDLSSMKYYSFVPAKLERLSGGLIKEEDVMIAHTGYTGEDGCEIILANDFAPAVWRRLIELGAKPCGLGARDSLRLEAAMPLHGHDLNESITPLEAGLGWAINWEHDFIGKPVLFKQKESGLTRFFKCFILENGIARENSEIIHGSKTIGKVSSGGFSPTLKKAICMGYVSENLETGAKVDIIVHGQPRKAEVVKRPFYKRK